MTEVRSLSESVKWVHDCYEIDSGDHMHRSQYLIDAADGTVVVDVGAPDVEDLIATIKQESETGQLDSVFLTASILPHTNQVSRITDEWPGVRIYAPNALPAITGVVEAEGFITCETDVVSGDTFSTFRPVITSLSSSQWIFHHESETLFTAEGVGHYHQAGDCDQLSTELEGGVSVANIYQFNKDKMPWMEYCDPSKVREGFERFLFDDGYAGVLNELAHSEDYREVLADMKCDYIAPIHGNPVARADIEEYVNRIVAAVEMINEDYRESSYSDIQPTIQRS